MHIMLLGTLVMATAFLDVFYPPLGPANLWPAFLLVILRGGAMASRMPIHLRISQLEPSTFPSSALSCSARRRC